MSPGRAAALVALAAAVLTGCGPAAAATPAAEPPHAPSPPGMTQYRIPDANYPDITAAEVTAWCDGTTRVHILIPYQSSYDPHVVQDIEPGSPLCGAPRR